MLTPAVADGDVVEQRGQGTDGRDDVGVGGPLEGADALVSSWTYLADGTKIGAYHSWLEEFDPSGSGDVPCQHNAGERCHGEWPDCEERE